MVNCTVTNVPYPGLLHITVIYTTLFPSDYVYTSNNASMSLCPFVQGIWLHEVKFLYE